MSQKTLKKRFAQEAWNIVPSETDSKSFSLKNTGGELVCTLVFPRVQYKTNLDLIALAPELLAIVEMYHDHMINSEAQNTMAFYMVHEILCRLQ